MKEPIREANAAQEKRDKGLYTIPNEVSCSAEFPEGCIRGR